MCVYRSTLPSSTSDTPNFLILGRETRVSDHLIYDVPAPESSVYEYVGELIECMRAAHKMLSEKQWQVRSEDSREAPLYQVWDWVWMASHRGRAYSWLSYSLSSWAPNL